MSKAVNLGTLADDISVSNGSVSLATSEIILPKHSTDPGNPVEGQLYYNTTFRRPRIYNNNAWLTFGSGKDGLTQSTPAESIQGIKDNIENPISGRYYFQIPQINSGNVFSAYCDFTMDGGQGYIFLVNQWFTGSETGPSHSAMGQTTQTGTIGFSDEFVLFPSSFFDNYSFTKLMVFARSNDGTSTGGITSSSTHRYVVFTGGTGSNYKSFFTNLYNTNQFTTNFYSSNANSGTAYFPNAHGSNGGVMQVSTNGGTINNYLLFEYNPNGGSDPNHFWSVYNGQDGDNYFGINGTYGSNSSNALYNRWGGIAVG